ncbi:amino acid ABC transporter permease [Orenia marismortui]|uniref:Amino acid ABC transporter membrane protein (PAAT family) n=1 Tax=Orenia marismortui TaxID=46469 RepID=A0A4R8GQG6_9FIRM|nr:amino acid ABC transporter permease [Orenia marismortui]TDX48012.1 amino acid ABC transporter membrane protein (PAAT family) [Orenia marismortui]
MSYILDITKFILGGLTVTLKLYIVTAIFCLPLGIILALAKSSKFKVLNRILGIYTWIFRGTPLLLQLFFIYYGLPIIFESLTLTPFLAASITFVINYSAYLTEIFRAGIGSIDDGQYEAAHALGMNYRQTMTRIIIPQAIRRVIPPICNEAINLVKDTALVVTIGMGDLLRSAKEVVTRDFTITPFIVAAIFYLLISSIIVSVFKRIEDKYCISE